MRGSVWASSTGAALYRVFVAPIEHSHLHSPQMMHLTRAQAPKLYLTSRHQKRTFTSLLSLRNLENRLPRGTEIQDRMVHVVTEDGTLSRPQHTSQVINSIDPRTHMLIMVALASKSNSNDAHEWPICKIVDRKEQYSMERAKAKKKSNPSSILKTIELSWTIDRHDLNHRLERMQGFLTKGFKVDVIMAAKKRGRKATTNEIANVLASVRSAITDVEGAKEWREIERKGSGATTIYAEGKKAVS